MKVTRDGDRRYLQMYCDDPISGKAVKQHDGLFTTDEAERVRERYKSVETNTNTLEARSSGPSIKESDKRLYVEAGEEQEAASDA